MHVHRKRNRSRSISIVVVDKRLGRYREIRNFGTSADAAELERMETEARHWVLTCGGTQSLIDFDDLRGRELEETERVVGNMEAVLINGTQLLLSQVYDSVGFDRHR